MPKLITFITDSQTRILGLHSFALKSDGFLHCGLNFYYGKMSRGLYKPLIEPCGYAQRQGASYLVYPGLNCALASLREIYMREAMRGFRELINSEIAKRI